MSSQDASWQQPVPETISPPRVRPRSHRYSQAAIATVLDQKFRGQGAVQKPLLNKRRCGSNPTDMRQPKIACVSHVMSISLEVWKMRM